MGHPDLVTWVAFGAAFGFFAVIGVMLGAVINSFFRRR